MTCYFSELWDSRGGAGARHERDGQGSRSVVSRLHPSRGGDSGAGEAGVVAAIEGLSICYCVIIYFFVSSSLSFTICICHKNALLKKAQHFMLCTGHQKYCARTRTFFFYFLTSILMWH